MTDWLKRIRGAVGMGLTWAIPWSAIGTVVAVFPGATPPADRRRDTGAAVRLPRTSYLFLTPRTAMTESPRTLRLVVTGALLLLIAMLVLQALGYGIGFFVDPASGLVEFASPPPPEDDDLTIALIGLIGVGMLAAATILVCSAVLVLKSNPIGPLIAMALGSVYMLAGVSVFRAGWTWDASFYAGSGGLLLLLSGAAHRLRGS